MESVVGMNPFWRDRSVFVTGGTGLLGSWLVKQLIDSGSNVVCLVRDWVPQSELVRTGTLDRVRVVRGVELNCGFPTPVIGESAAGGDRFVLSQVSKARSPPLGRGPVRGGPDLGNPGSVRG